MWAKFEPSTYADNKYLISENIKDIPALSTSPVYRKIQNAC